MASLLAAVKVSKGLSRRLQLAMLALLTNPVQFELVAELN